MSKAFYIADTLLYRSSNLDGHAATVHQLYTIGSVERDFFCRAAQWSAPFATTNVRPSVRLSVDQRQKQSVTLVIHA